MQRTSDISVLCLRDVGAAGFRVSFVQEIKFVAYLNSPSHLLRVRRRAHDLYRADLIDAASPQDLYAYLDECVVRRSRPTGMGTGPASMSTCSSAGVPRRVPEMVAAVICALEAASTRHARLVAEFTKQSKATADRADGDLVGWRFGKAGARLQWSTGDERWPRT